MRRTFTVYLSLIIIIFTSACTTNRNVSLKDELASEIKSSEITMIQTQSELNAEIDESQMLGWGALGFGLAGALVFGLVDAAVNDSRTEDAEAAVAPVRNQLLDHNAGPVLERELTPVLNETEWLHLKSFKRIEGDPKVLRWEVISSAEQDTVGLISYSYGLSPDLSALKTRILFELFPVSDNLKKMAVETEGDGANPIYRTEVNYSHSMPDPTENREENAKVWADKNGLLIKEALDISFKKIAQLLELQLRHPEKKGK